MLLLTVAAVPAAAQMSDSFSADKSASAGDEYRDATAADAGYEELLSARARAEMSATPARLSPPMHPLIIAAGASAGGALGTVVGSEFQEDCEQRCINARGALGPIVANTALIPLGSHLAGLGRGDMLSAGLVSAGWGGAAIVTAGLTDETWPVWAAIPGQVLSTVIIECYTVRRRAQKAELR